MLNCLANSAASAVSSPKLPPSLGAIVWTSAIRRWNSIDSVTASCKASRIWLMARTIIWVITTRAKVCQLMVNPLVFLSASSAPPATSLPACPPLFPASCNAAPAAPAEPPSCDIAWLARWISSLTPEGNQRGEVAAAGWAAGVAAPPPIFAMELDSREAADAMSFIVSKALAAWLFQAFIVVPNVWKALPAVCSASSNR